MFKVRVMTLRQDRVADQIRDILATTFGRGLVRDPRLQETTITFVKLSADLQLATVYFRCYGATSSEDASQAFKGCSGFLRKQLAGQLDLRRVPELRFFYDESIEKSERIESLLQNNRGEFVDDEGED